MRAVNRIVSGVLALALLAAAVVVIVEIILAALGHKPYLVHWNVIWDALTRNTWRDVGTQITGVVLVLVGLLLLILGFGGGRPDTLELAGSTSGAIVTITRRSLQQALKNAGASTEGVQKARVAVRRRKVKVKVSSAMLQAAPVRQAVEASTGRLLDGLGLARPLRVNTKVKLRSIGLGA